MQTHGTGAIKGSRQGSYPTNQSYVLTYLNTTAGTNTDVKLFTIEASPTKPVAYRTRAILQEAWNDVGADTLSVGTAQGGTQLLNAVDLKGAAGVNYAPANLEALAIADTDIWARVSRAGSGGSVGRVGLKIELMELNVQVPSTPE